MRKISSFIVFIFFFCIITNALAVQKGKTSKSIQKFPKILSQYGNEDRKEGIHNANEITTVFYNYGTIGQPGNTLSLKWPRENGFSYGREFGLLVGAEVLDAYGVERHIFSEGFLEGGDVGPNWKPWGWEPLAGFAAADQPSLAMSDNPESWPASWTAWPGEFGEGVMVADQESYYVMDDRENVEALYFPVPEDSSIRGLGIEVKSRGYQWSDSKNTDYLIFKYKIKNVSSNVLEKVVAGILGDVDMGEGGDYADDCVGFLNHEGEDYSTGLQFALNDLIYFWDNDFYGGPVQQDNIGWFGIKFLETPKSNTGEHLGLTSIATYSWGVYSPGIDEAIWNLMSPGHIEGFEQNIDQVAVGGSGYFLLDPGESQNFAVAFVFGRTKFDLFSNARNSVLKYVGLAQQLAHQATFSAPGLNEEISGTYEIKWTTASASGSPLKIDINYNLNRPDTWWQPLARNIDDTGSYLWDTSLFEDGYNYQVEIIAYDSAGYGRAVSDFFIVNNAEKDAPLDITLLYPGEEETLSEIVEIQWRAGDAEGNTTTIDILFQKKEEEEWQILAEGEANDGSYVWDTKQYPNGSSYRLKLAVTDGVDVVETEPSRQFKIWNEYPALSDSSVVHTQGDGDGSVQVNIIDPIATTGHLYQLSFDDITFDYTTYNVRDVETGAFVVQNATQLTPEVAGPYFDGLRLVINTPEQAQIDTINTGWISGDANLNFEAVLYNNQGVPAPYDYEIEFFNTIVDSSINGNKPANFHTRELSTNQAVEFAFADVNANGFVDSQDMITPIVYVSGRPKGTWQVTFSDPESGNPNPPKTGDAFRISTWKPYSSGDVFEFRAPMPASVEESATRQPQSFFLFQNFPNPFNSTTRIQYELPGNALVKLTIYNIMGQEVIKLVEEKQAAGYKSIVWDGKNSRGDFVNSGLYMCCLEYSGKRISKKLVLLK